MNHQNFSKGETVFSEGDRMDRLYFVKSGMVRLTKSTDEGHTLSFYHFRTGDLIGQLEGAGHTSSFTAETLTGCRIGIIRRRDLEEAIRRNGDLAIDFMRWLSFMNHFTQTKLRDLMFFGKNGALASTLLRIANTYGVPEDGKIRFTMKFTNAEIADMIGATRETVNRLLTQFKKDGIIGYENGSIVITDREALKSICHCENCPLSVCRL
ncbi:Crp/Fnr family transcriptional regulator [Indiicoccus explosivorum]|uniref:Crp/Fnr family transcriptional regulator n=1 Tax=Indiicoccus explosivorum TaxID=1917864 RepID=UPI00138FD6DF|nr:Crp/Fnr family transcriptional regulator [Indiicoccus explosivorum]